jgi:hypothetical protein
MDDIMTPALAAKIALGINGTLACHFKCHQCGTDTKPNPRATQYAVLTWIKKRRFDCGRCNKGDLLLVKVWEVDDE